MSVPLYQVDAFTDRPFAGNPAAVCLLSEPRPDAWQQAVAAEMNLAETAFLLPEEDSWRLRWFTPAVEVDLCGHATLASAHVLWETGRLPGDATARFRTRSGVLTASRRGAWIDLDFPATPVQPADEPAGLADALGVRGRHRGKTRGGYHLVELDSEEAVRSVRPDFARLAELSEFAVMVTSRAASPGYDFVSRFFAPGAGVPEDPVTGSAHCCLGPFWSERLGKQDLVGFQASARSGVVRVGVRGDRVHLGGQAVLVLRGELL
jgi:PhzF family phenazine biosynthesis protein